MTNVDHIVTFSARIVRRLTICRTIVACFAWLGLRIVYKTFRSAFCLAINFDGKIVDSVTVLINVIIGDHTKSKGAVVVVVQPPTVGDRQFNVIRRTVTFGRTDEAQSVGIAITKGNGFILVVVRRFRG